MRVSNIAHENNNYFSSQNNYSVEE